MQDAYRYMNTNVLSADSKIGAFAVLVFSRGMLPVLS